MTQKTLIPPDIDRCQAEVLQGSFMTFGPRETVRCSEKPVYIATENKPGKDGLVGSMSLCEACKEKLIQKLGADFASFQLISELIR